MGLSLPLNALAMNFAI